jgi:hypothetical protein
MYYSNEALQPGEIVVLDASGSAAIKTSNIGNDPKVIGVIATNPGVILAGNSVYDDQTGIADPNFYPLTISGQAPVKVSTENGAIEIGDYLTTSSIPGVAMKATQKGQVIGQAVESYEGNDIGTIKVFVHLTNIDDPSKLVYDGNGDWTHNGNFNITQALGVNSINLTAGTLSSINGNMINQLNQDMFGTTNTKFTVENSLGNEVFSVDSSGSAVFAGSLTTSGGTYDLAEDYPASDSSLEAGDVVAIDKNSDGHVQKSSTAYDSSVLGIYSEKPGFRLSQLTTENNGEKAVPVALTGRVPVKVSNVNGEIQKGDYLTASSTPGVAMKATQPGQVIGKALEDMNCPINPDTDVCTAKVLTAVNVTFADPENALADAGISRYSTKDIALDNDLIINGQVVNGSLDNALLAINNGLNDLNTRISNIETAAASNSANIAMNTDLAKRAMDNAYTLGDRVTALEAEVASNSGVLTETISDLSMVKQQMSDYASRLTSADMLISTESGLLTDSGTRSDATISGELLANSATVMDTFKSFGKTYLFDTTIAGRLGILDNMDISQNSINVTGNSPDANGQDSDGVLYMQNAASANQIDMFNGAAVINKDGSFATKGNVNIGGNLNVEGAITITATAGEDIRAQDVLYISDSGTVKRADATTADKLDIIGIAQNDTPAGKTVTIIVGGKAKGFSNLQSGKRYFLGDNATVVTDPPTDAIKEVSVGIAYSDTELIIQVGPAFIYNQLSSAVTPIPTPTP